MANVAKGLNPTLLTLPLSKFLGFPVPEISGALTFPSLKKIISNRSIFGQSNIY